MADRGPGRGAGLAQAAALIALVTAVSRVIGFAREAVFAATFGASGAFDAYLVALGIPNIAIALLSSAIVTTMVPVLAGQVASGDRAAADRTFVSVCVTVLAALAVASALMAVFAETVVAVLAPGFPPERTELAAALTRILLLATVLVAGMNLLTAYLQAHRRFFWPAFVGVPFNLVLIAAAVLFGARYGVTALAVGFVVGSALRVAVQVPALRASGFRTRGRPDRHDAGLRNVVRFAPLVLLGHSLANVNTFVDRAVGSLQTAGTISALNYGWRLVTLPHGLLTMALLQAVYPAFGAADATGDRAAFAELVRRSLGVLLVLLTPVAAVLVVLRVPIVEFVYERGDFTARDTALTAAALAAYAVGLVALGLRDVVNRALYAVQDTRTPVVVSVAGMAVNVTGDLTLGRALGVTGLALSTSLSLLGALGLGLRSLQRRERLVDLRAVAVTAARCAAAAVAAGGVMHVTYVALRARWVDDPSGAGIPGGGLELALVLLPAVTGGVVYLALLAGLRTRELTETAATAAAVAARLRRRPPQPSPPGG